MLRRTFFMTATALSLSLMPFSVAAQSGEKLNLLVGEWAVGPLTPWVEQFTKYTGIEVEIQGFPFRDLLKTIEVRGKAKATDVDAIFVDAPLVPSYAVRGIISSMGPYITESEAQNIWADATVAAATWQGEIWAPPLNNSSQLLFYNKDLLDAAGIDAPSSDPALRITWEQLVENAKKMVDADAGVWGMTFDQVSRYYQLQALPESAGGGSGVDASGTSVEGMLTNEGWLKAAKFYYDTFNTWNISPKGVSPDQTQALFTSGKVAYFVGGPWNIKPMVDSGVNFGMALHPYFKGGVPKTPTNSWHMGVWNYSEHKDAAAQLVRFLTASPEVAIDYTEQYGQLPAHFAALRNIQESPRYSSFPDIGLRMAAYEAANTAVTRARTPAFLEFEEIVNNSFEDIRNGGDPATVLGEAEQRIQSAMRRYR